MLDVLFLALTLAGFALVGLVVAGLERLLARSGPPSARSSIVEEERP